MAVEQTRMGWSRRIWFLVVGLLALAQLSPPAIGVSTVVPAGVQEVRGARAARMEADETSVTAARWLRAAQTVQATTRAHLRVTDQLTCAQASYVSYRRSDIQPDVADQWYVASQLWADAELLRATSGQPLLVAGRVSDSGLVASPDDEAGCHLAKGFVFLDRLREAGGYLARAAPDGSGLSRGVHYADDNALAGLSLLAAAEVENDPTERQRYLDAARSVGAFLTTSGLWDETFGGGFWWNSNKGDRWEGKPAQSNALCALFFARLQAATGDAVYGDWAERTIGWLDAVLYDPEIRLYRWSIRYSDLRNRTGAPILNNRYFNYDQAIAIEAQIAIGRQDGRADRLDRARDLGHVMQAALWNPTHGGYNLEVGVERIYASYGAWASFGHLALYDLDGDPAWLELARLNAESLDVMFRRTDSGYGYRHFRCVTTIERSRPGCESGEAVWVLDQTRDGAAQAWMQHLQAALACRYAALSL